jgi:2-methylcitrate dehydratase
MMAWNMSNVANQQDEVAALLAAYTADVSGTLDARTARAARAVLTDSLAVAMGALTHPAAQAARRHAYRFPATGGCVIWGSPRRGTPEIAALVNGVLLRCYDYNDFLVGRRNSGHPSDIIAGVIAAAEWAEVSGQKLLSAIAIGYEVVAAAYDAFSTAPGGWDYTNLSALGATCAIARVLGLDADHTREALAMTVIPHFASDEIESGDLNTRGDLTMWKRFNGSDAVRNALQACLLASVGVEGAVRPFVGRQGFIAKLANRAEDCIPVLRACLDPARPVTRIVEANMKRWPVGSLAQSAIQAALEARGKLGADADDPVRIRQVRVFCEEGAYEHLVKIRAAPFAPISRETADHSMPYIVAAAVLDGFIRTDSFAPDLVRDPERLRFLQEKVTVAPAPELGTLAGGKHKRHAAGYLSRVEIERVDSTVFRGDAKPFPGHPSNPFTDADLADKLFDNMGPIAGRAHTEDLTKRIAAVEAIRNVRELTALLALPQECGVDDPVVDRAAPPA